MPISQRYLIVKEKDDKEIKYFEYEKINGYDIKPNTRIRDAININKMVIINPSLIEKMVDKKINKRFSKLISFLAVIFTDDDDSGTSYMEALNEISKLRLEANNKYRIYMEKEKFILLQKKLDILENEVKERLLVITDSKDNSYGGKAR